MFGFVLVVVNLCLYAGFIIHESIAYHGQPASQGAMWEVRGFYSALFLTALFAAHFLKSKTHAIRSSSR
jgi:hypothetical protein